MHVNEIIKQQLKEEKLLKKKRRRKRFWRVRAESFLTISMQWNTVQSSKKKIFLCTLIKSHTQAILGVEG